MKACTLKKGTVVQLNPETVVNKAFGACFMVITEPKSWGAQGYVSVPKDRSELPEAAYYRAKWEEMELIGGALWVINSSYEQEEKK